MVNRDVVKAKINRIEHCLRRLESLRNISLNELKDNQDAQDIILHNLQTAIQGCIDIAGHIISDSGWDVPGTLAGVFDVLRKHKVIPAKLNNALRKMAGFRNIIVHEYEAVDLRIVRNILLNHLKTIRLYLKEICAFSGI